MDRVRKTIKFEGLIQLQCVDGFLCGAGIESSRLFLRSPAVNDTGDEVFPCFHFSPMVFKVVPTLSSIATAAKLLNRSGGNNKDIRQMIAEESDLYGDGSATTGTAAGAHLEGAAAAINNQEVTYGMCFSLVHVASNLYVSANHSQRSQNDPDCVSIVLIAASSANSTACEFTFTPRYKILSDGDKVCRDDEVMIRLAAKPLYLHVSSPRELDATLPPEDIAALDRTFRLGSRLSFHKVPPSYQRKTAANFDSSMSYAMGSIASGSTCRLNNSPLVIQALTREHLDEVNGCEEGGVSFTIHRYDVEIDRAMAQKAQLHINHAHIPCGVPVAFFHRERESFLTTSVNLPRPYLSNAAALIDSMDEPPRLRQRQPYAATDQVAASTGAEGQIHEMTTQPDQALSDNGSVSGTGTPQPEGAAVSVAISNACSFRSERARKAMKQKRVSGLIDVGGGELMPFPIFAGPAVDESEETSMSERDATLADSSCNITGLWMVEGEDPSHGGPVKIGNTYRVKHIYTGLYLAVCGSAVDDLYADDDEDLSDGVLASERGVSSDSDVEGHLEGTVGSGSKDAIAAAGTNTPPPQSSPIPNVSFMSSMGMNANVSRETELCLIMEPRSRKDLERTCFTFEYMFANEANYLFEQDSIVLKNTVTGMYVATDSSVPGSNIRLQLQWQHRASDTIVATTIAPEVQRSALFIRQQCIWLSRFRSQMQAAAADFQRDMVALKREAEKGNESAIHWLEHTAASEERMTRELEVKKEGDADLNLLEEHRMRIFSALHGQPKKKRKKKKGTMEGWEMSFRGKQTTSPEDDEDDDEVEHIHPRYRCLQHTIHLCQRSLTTLIRFCTASTEHNPLVREGLPIKENQRMLYDIQLYKLLFEVIMSPFCLVNPAQFSLEPRSFSEIGTYENSRLYETIMQRQSTDRLWDASSAKDSDAGHLPSLPLKGGVVSLEHISHPLHAEIHLCCRLALRLLQQMIRGDSSLSRGWEKYLAHCVFLDGHRLHVIEVLQEMFTDNPRVALSDIRLVAKHFISATKAIPRAAYLKFLGAAVTVGSRGARERQAYVCKKLLVQNPQLFHQFVMDDTGQGLCVLLNTPNSSPIPFQTFFTTSVNTQTVNFIHGQMRLMTRLCFDQSPKDCVALVRSLVPMEGMIMILRTMWSSFANPQLSTGVGKQATSLQMLRIQIVRLAFLTYVRPRMVEPRVQIRLNTVLFGASKLRPPRDTGCITLSGLPDEEIGALIKQTALAIMRANPSLVQGDAVQMELLKSSVETWQRFIECKQYSQDDIRQAIPLLMHLLDTTHDIIGTQKASLKDQRKRESKRYMLDAESSPLMLIRETVCKCILKALRNEIDRTADEMIQFLYHVYTHGLVESDPRPWQPQGERSEKGLVNVVVHSVYRGAVGAARTAVGVAGGRRSDGYAELSDNGSSVEEGDEFAYEREELEDSEEDAKKPNVVVATEQKKRSFWPWRRRNVQVTEAEAEEEPARYYDVTPEDIEAYIDMMVDRVHDMFEPDRLVPLLLKITRYENNNLTVQSMRLLVQLTIVKRCIAQQVLKVNTLPCESVRQGFDYAHEVAVKLKNAFVTSGRYTEKWLEFIHETAVTLVEKFTMSDEDSSAALNSTGRDSTSNFTNMYRSLNQISDGQPPGTPGSPGGGSLSHMPSLGSALMTAMGGGFAAANIAASAPTTTPSGALTAQTEAVKRRATELWSRLAVATRLIVFENTIARRRKALGIFDGDNRGNVEISIRADFMAHFKVHETLLRMLPMVPTDSEAYFHVIRFFYLFSLSRNTAKCLRPFLDVFLRAIHVSPRTHVMCLHIVINIMSIMNDINEFLTSQLLLSFIKRIDLEVSTSLPDPDLTEKLSNQIFTKASVSVVVRRRMMILLREQQTLRHLSNPPHHPSPAVVTFTSSLVNLMCNVCGSHVSVLNLARGLLPAFCIGKLVERRLRKVKDKLLSSTKVFRHVTDSETVSFKLLNPYVRALVALYFTSSDDTDEDKKRRRSEWTSNTLLWSIFRSYVTLVTEATRLMREGGEMGFHTPETNRGMAGVLLYRIFFLRTVPVSLAAYFINCFDTNVYYQTRNGDQLIESTLLELVRAMRRFGETLLEFAEPLDLYTSEVINFRRTMGVLQQVCRNTGMESELKAGDQVVKSMRHWLLCRYRASQKLESQESFAQQMKEEEAATAETDMDNDREDEMFDVLVKAELVSQAFQSRPSTHHYRLPCFSPPGAPVHAGEAMAHFTPLTSPRSAAHWTTGSTECGEGTCNAMTVVQVTLEKMLEGNELIPPVDEKPSSVALTANRILLHSLEDRSTRKCVKRVLLAMKDRLFTARTFVGLLNLFYNALDCALRFPQDVESILSSRGPKQVGRKGAFNLASSFTGEAVKALQTLKDAAIPFRSGGEQGLSAACKQLGPNLQHIFSELGMMEVVVTLSGVDDDVVTLNALRVATALLDEGNKNVQKALLSYFETREERFFNNIRHILRKNLEWVQYVNSEHQYYLLKRGLQASVAGMGNETSSVNIQLVQALRPSGPNALVCMKDPNENRRMGWPRMQGLRRLLLVGNVFRLLQLFCEGHFVGMQHYIRAQHDNLHTTNMIHESMLLLTQLCVFITPANLPVVIQGFELLTEVCQGPCHANQEAVVDFGAGGMMTRLLHLAQVMEAQIQAHQRRHSPSSLLQTLTTTSTICVGDDTEEMLEESITMTELADLRFAISETAISIIEGCRNAEFLEKLLVQFPLKTIEEEIALVDPKQYYYIAHNTNDSGEDVRSEALFQWIIFLKTVHPHVNETDAQIIDDLLSNCRELTSNVGQLEISREEDIEVVYFRIPPLCFSLTDDRKDELLWEVDRTSRATKLSDFLQKSDELIFSMEQLHNFRQWLERWTQFHVKYEPDAPWRSAMIAKYKLFFNEYISHYVFSYQINYYEQVSMVIAVLVNCMLTVIAGDTSDRWSTLQQYQAPIVRSLCILQTIVCVVVLMIGLSVNFPIYLYIKYKEKQRFNEGEAKLNLTLTEVYAGFTVREKAHLLLSNFVVQLRVFFILMAALSVVVSPYFAAFNLMLLIYKISTLRTFISAITMNGKQLLLTAFLGLIILYLFSIVGFLVFSSEFNPDAEDSAALAEVNEYGVTDNNCETLLRCFTFIFSNGLRAGGGVGDVMKPWTWGEKDLLPRVQYDLLFYVIVNVIFLNIMFGIIIDTFGQMRDEKREKEADMHGLCFICGLESDVLEKIAPNGFHTHVRNEHNMWMYLYFMHHLRRKDPNSYTGQESYVQAKIQSNRVTFFPNNTCISLTEMSKKEKEAATSSDEDEDDEDAQSITGGSGGSDGQRRGNRNNANDQTKNLIAVAKEVASMKEALLSTVKDLSGDSQRLKAVMQQLELAAKGGGSMFGSNAFDNGPGAPSQGRQSAGTRRFAGGPSSERGSHRTLQFSQPPVDSSKPPGFRPPVP